MRYGILDEDADEISFGAFRRSRMAGLGQVVRRQDKNGRRDRDGDGDQGICVWASSRVPGCDVWELCGD